MNSITSAIYYYKDEGYRSINRSLREGIKLIRIFRPDAAERFWINITALDKSMTPLPAMIIWRGTKRSFLTLFQTDPAYQSCSLSRRTAERFKINVLYRIKVRKGAAGAKLDDLCPYSYNSCEGEILLPRNARLWPYFARPLNWHLTKWLIYARYR